MKNFLSVFKKENTKIKYEVTITTSNGYVGAGGVKNVVYLEMTARNGRKTSEIPLHNGFDILFKRGETDVFEIEAEDVGLPIIIKLRLKSIIHEDPWAVRDVTIKLGDKKALFPIHDWIKDEISVTHGKALLSQKIKNLYVANMRKEEVEKSRLLLQWSSIPGPSDLGRGFPRHVKTPASITDFPLIFQPTEIWTKNFVGNALESTLLSALKKLKGRFFALDSLENYECLFELFEPKGEERSPYLDRWKTDEEFGRQQMNSISPTSFEICTKIPENCQISDEDVKDFLNGKTLDEEIKSGNIFIADYSQVYQEVNRNKNENDEILYCPDAVCLYRVNDFEDLVPIAIQLVPNEKETIFTPNDSEDDWLLAKMYFRVAFGNMHETVSIINSLARTTLIAAGTIANRSFAIEGESLARSTYNDFTLEDLMIPNVLKKKGLDDKTKLTKFYYRDDALALWDVIKTFVTDVIKQYYESDEDVREDADLQLFVKDVGEEGLGWNDGTTRGVPVPIENVESLIRICTCIIFTSSAQHAAVNFQQYDIYKFVPHSPVAMMLPPHKKGEASMQRILDSLPDTITAVTAIATVKSVSAYSPDEVFLGNYPVQLFTETGVLEAIERYKKALDKYALGIHRRNAETEYPYHQLLPNKVPNSIAI